MNQFGKRQPTPGDDWGDRLHEDNPGPQRPGNPQAGASQVFYAGSGNASAPCQTCGFAVLVTAMGCPNCGSMFFSPRSKRTAVALAVLLTFWTWYYTYRKDKRKFWVGLAVDVVALVLPHAGVGLVLLSGVWVWAVVDAAIKPVAWYGRYPRQP